MKIPLTRPLFGKEEERRVQAVLRSGWVTQGPEVAAFEEEFAAYTGSEYACAVSNCTAALHLALLAAGINPGDEVITVSHSFIATANSIRYCGAVPVFVDIETETFNIDPRLIEAAITARTRAILCVHQMGMPCDLKSILALAGRHNLVVIEDAACAIGSEINLEGGWEKIGKPRGQIACFSFHPRKVITTGDGGMLTTANPEWDAKFRLLRQHCMSVPDRARHEARKTVFESYLDLGYNYRMTDLQAAVGRAQLERLPGILGERRRLADRYDNLLAEVTGIVPPRQPDWVRSNRQSYCVRLPGEVDQRRVMDFMLERDIATRRGIMCIHREPAYRGRTGSPALPRSEEAQDSGLILPLFPGLEETEQDYVVSALREAVRAAAK